jgi:serine/threonine-protein kinase RsbT
LKDGFTSGGGLGLGLGGAKRLVNEFEIVSRAGEGTRIIITRWK